MKHEAENSLQTASRWAWNGVKVVYAAHAVGSLLCPNLPTPKMSKAARLDALETNEKTFAALLEKRNQLLEDAKAALAVPLTNEDDYVNSSTYMVEMAQEMIGEWDALAHEDYLSGAMRAQCKQFTQEMRNLDYIWYRINNVRKHQAYLGEEKFLIKTGAKSKFDSQYDKFGYAAGLFSAKVAWAIIAIVVFGGWIALCIYGLTASGLIPE